MLGTGTGLRVHFKLGQCLRLHAMQDHRLWRKQPRPHHIILPLSHSSIQFTGALRWLDQVSPQGNVEAAQLHANRALCLMKLQPHMGAQAEAEASCAVALDPASHKAGVVCVWCEGSCMHSDVAAAARPHCLRCMHNFIPVHATLLRGLAGLARKRRPMNSCLHRYALHASRPCTVVRAQGGCCVISRGQCRTAMLPWPCCSPSSSRPAVLHKQLQQPLLSRILSSCSPSCRPAGTQAHGAHRGAPVSPVTAALYPRSNSQATWQPQGRTCTRTLSSAAQASCACRSAKPWAGTWWQPGPPLRAAGSQGWTCCRSGLLPLSSTSGKGPSAAGRVGCSWGRGLRSQAKTPGAGGLLCTASIARWWVSGKQMPAINE